MLETELEALAREDVNQEHAGMMHAFLTALEQLKGDMAQPALTYVPTLSVSWINASCEVDDDGYFVYVYPSKGAQYTNPTEAAKYLLSEWK